MPKNQHVVPHGNEWAVRGEGNGRPTSIHRTQAEAIEAAREIAKKQQSELVIHRLDGRVRYRDSYGSDPLPPKSPRKVLFPPRPDVTNPDKVRTVVKEVVSERSRRDSHGSDPFPPRDQRH
jgi:hypothetical protein